MAIFIDNVVSRSLKRKLNELGDSTLDTERRIKETVAMLISEDPAWDSSVLFDELDASPILPTNPLQCINIDKAFRALEEINLGKSITSMEFHKWLEYGEMHAMLSDSEIDVSVKADLFNVLDADKSGELELSEVVVGLMKMRGPITKSDMVAVRMKVGHLVDLVDDVKATQRLMLAKLDGVPCKATC